MEAWKARVGYSLDKRYSHLDEGGQLSNVNMVHVNEMMVLFRGPLRDEIAFVEDEDEVLVRSVLLQVLLDAPRPRAKRIARIEHLDDHIRRIEHFVQL